MSVPLNKRTQGKLDVIIKANALCKYTLTITANEKKFDPKFQRSLTDKINDTAISIFIDCFTANNVYVNSAEDAKERDCLQERAARSCNDLLALIQIAKSVYHLETKRVQHWGEDTIGETTHLKETHGICYNGWMCITTIYGV